eukprot:11275547-Alexandrium_andersonii.AAC.1
MSASLVGSEMCIRDSPLVLPLSNHPHPRLIPNTTPAPGPRPNQVLRRERERESGEKGTVRGRGRAEGRWGP